MKIALVGLGYVGLPLAVAFSEHYDVIGFDLNKEKISLLKRYVDYTGEIDPEKLKSERLKFTNNPSELRQADLIIIAVPTPIHEESKQPDLSPVENASELIGDNIKRGAIVVYESTVYPGVTEDICVPIIERRSNLKCGTDWKIGYSPERINPGDKLHTVNTITKIVSGMDEKSLNIIAEVYGKICPVHKVSSIKVAEASKVIENVQRDLNIALMNELGLIFDRMGIDVKEVIDAASTKWNFHKYYPGLVGGHCIGVDPYYLTYAAIKHGYYPKVILSGREVNENIALHLSRKLLKSFGASGKSLKDCNVLVMGLTFKENVPDTRNSKINLLIKELKDFGVNVIGYEPLISAERAKKEFGIDNVPLQNIKTKLDAIVLAQAHNSFKGITLDRLKQVTCDKPVLLDIKRLYDKKEAEKTGFLYQHI